MMRHKRSGVAAIEMIMAGAVLALAAGLVVPFMSEKRLADERARALGDLRQLAADMLSYRGDTGVWPDSSPFAFTDGPSAAGESSFGRESAGRHVSSFLVSNGAGVGNWKGPYMSLVRPDPWGHRYVVVLEGLNRQDGRAWVLSAGPDGAFETGKNDGLVRGDDLGLLLR